MKTKQLSQGRQTTSPKASPVGRREVSRCCDFSFDNEICKNRLQLSQSIIVFTPDNFHTGYPRVQSTSTINPLSTQFRAMDKVTSTLQVGTLLRQARTRAPDSQIVLYFSAQELKAAEDRLEQMLAFVREHSLEALRTIRQGIASSVTDLLRNVEAGGTPSSAKVRGTTSHTVPLSRLINRTQ